MGQHRLNRIDGEGVLRPTHTKLHTNPPLLSVCMITKNESANIAECLRSVLPFADEIIINDTGSTDDTVQIAESYGAFVVHSDWVDDFSFSRNISLKKATGVWIMWLDADDRIPDESIDKLNDLKRRTPDRIYGIICSSLGPGGSNSKSRQARIFPNNRGVYFERPIHEQISYSAGRAGLKIEFTDIIVNHEGYKDSGTVKLKALRNSRILLKEYLNGDKSAYNLFKLGEDLRVSGDYVEAERYYREYLEIKNHMEEYPEYSGNVLLGLSRSLNQRGEIEESISSLRRGLQTSVKRPDIRYALAVALMGCGKSKEAIMEFELILYKEYDVQIISMDTNRIIKNTLRNVLRLSKELKDRMRMRSLGDIIMRRYSVDHNNLNIAGEAYYLTGHHDRSLNAYERSISIKQKGNPDAFLAILNILAVLNRKEEAVMLAKRLEVAYRRLPKFAAVCSLYQLIDITNLEVDPDEVTQEIKNIEELYLNQSDPTLIYPVIKN